MHGNRDTIFTKISYVTNSASKLKKNQKNRNLAPGAALARRQRYKENKYQTHAINLNAKFTGFAMDSWGSLSTGALELVTKIVKDSNSPYAGRVSPLAMSKDSFLTQLSLQWQADTATMAHGNAQACHQTQHRPTLSRNRNLQ